MLVTNQTVQDYFFGPLHLPGGIGQSLTIDDSSATSLYLTNDDVAEQLAVASVAGKIVVSAVTAGINWPRATGTPEVLHGDGSPEGLIYAPQGSLYMNRSAASSTNALWTKTTGAHINTGWAPLNPGQPPLPTTNNQTASYTAALGDSGNIIEMNVASANTLTIPPNSSVPFSVGATITVIQSGAGISTITNGVGVTINATPGLKTAGQWAMATLLKRGTDLWIAAGNLTP